MKIAFLDPSGLDYTPETPLIRPLGGTQSAACHLAAALVRRGHEVTLAAGSRDESTVLGVRRRHYPDMLDAAELNQQDAVVVLTSPIAKTLKASGVTTRLINWQHKTAQSAGAAPFAEAEERAAWNATVFVSEHQKAAFTAKWGMDGQVLRNAISPPAALTTPGPSFIERGEDPTLIYASAPGRGLDFLLVAFPTIRKHLPGARLRVFSDQAMYQVPPEKDEFSVFYELARALPGVEHAGGVSQTDLAAAMAQADIWAYPTIFVETSCIVMMEAGAAGCMLAASKVGALPETGGRYAQLLEPGASRAGWSKNYAANLVRLVARARRDPAAYEAAMRKQAQWFRRSCSWDGRAEEWENWLATLPAN